MGNRDIHSGGGFIIALTGGIASGKSFIAGILEEQGACIVDTDIIARQVVKPGEDAYLDIVNEWGKDILKPDGSIDRAKLGSIVFSSQKDLEKLNRITHPRIRRIMTEQVNRCKKPVAVIVIPLLFEAEKPIPYHQSWLVYCTEAQQEERLINREGSSPDEARGRIKSQIPIEKKKEMADVIIDNSGDRENTKKAVLKQWRLLCDSLEARRS